MSSKATYIAGVVAATLVPNGAKACGPFILADLLRVFGPNNPTQSGPDCAFQNAGRHDAISGTAVTDHGDGIVTQVFRRAAPKSGCPSPGDPYTEYLGITDCTTGEQVSVHGVSDSHRLLVKDVVYVGAPSKIENATGLLGEMPLAGGEGFDQLRAAARQVDVDVTDSIVVHIPGAPEWDSFDPNCGCKLHYPGSAGALQ